MTEYDEILKDWIRRRENEYKKEFSCSLLPDSNGQQVQQGQQGQQGQQVHHLFDEHILSEDKFQIEEDEETGYTTITRRKCWIWPKFSNFGRLKSDAKLHHIIARLDGEGCIVSGSCIKLYYTDATVTCSTLRNGKLEGLTIRYFKDDVIWIGMVKNGVPVGVCVSREPEGRGTLIGQVDEAGEHSGTDISYLYPGSQLCLTGTFRNTEMVKALPSKIQELTVMDKEVKLEVEILNRYQNFNFSPPDYQGNITSRPLLRDPYENTVVEVSNSGMTGGGEGIFAIQDIPCGGLAAIFNGVKYPIGTYLAKDCKTDEEIYERMSYNIHMPQDEEYFLDIPPDLRSLDKYSATLGHKVNHSFRPNSVFATMFHPRFGRVRTVVATRDIFKGEEIFVDYEYDLIRCPEWYRELHRRQIEDEKNP